MKTKDFDEPRTPPPPAFSRELRVYSGSTAFKQSSAVLEDEENRSMDNGNRSDQQSQPSPYPVPRTTGKLRLKSDSGSQKNSISDISGHSSRYSPSIDSRSSSWSTPDEKHYSGHVFFPLASSEASQSHQHTIMLPLEGIYAPQTLPCDTTPSGYYFASSPMHPPVSSSPQFFSQDTSSDLSPQRPQEGGDIHSNSTLSSRFSISPCSNNSSSSINYSDKSSSTSYPSSHDPTNLGHSSHTLRHSENCGIDNNFLEILTERLLAVARRRENLDETLFDEPSLVSCDESSGSSSEGWSSEDTQTTDSSVRTVSCTSKAYVYQPNLERYSSSQTDTSESSCCSSIRPKFDEPAQKYRVIKRAESYLAEQQRIGISSPPYIVEPPKKKARTLSNISTHVSNRTYAKQTASLRRASSMKYDVGSEDQMIFAAKHGPTNRNMSKYHHGMLQAVPIIAPPPHHFGRLPLSNEASAKVRLGKLLIREGTGRDRDHLAAVQRRQHGFTVLQDEKSSNYRGDIGNAEDDDKENKNPNTTLDKGGPEGSFGWETVLGIGKELRETIVNWLLEVLPVYSTSPSSRTSRNSSFSGCSVASTSRINFDMLDQLLTSPETRFHAAWMFLRYYYLAMPNSLVHPYGSSNFDRQTNLQGDLLYGKKLVAWDTAVASLALSIKFHRDFLCPLYPVLSEEYVFLAPHSMDHEDLERAQRDVLSTFSYRLGITPQPVIDEIWASLPSIRELLAFDGAWNWVKRDTWRRLFGILYAPDVLNFPISLLTTAALVEAIISFLVWKYDYDLKWNLKITAKRGPGGNLKPCSESHPETQKRYISRAKRESEGVVLDIQATVGVTETQLQKCRQWLELVL